MSIIEILPIATSITALIISAVAARYTARNYQINVKAYHEKRMGETQKAKRELLDKYHEVCEETSELLSKLKLWRKWWPFEAGQITVVVEDTYKRVKEMEEWAKNTDFEVEQADKLKTDMTIIANETKETNRGMARGLKMLESISGAKSPQTNQLSHSLAKPPCTDKPPVTQKQ